MKERKEREKERRKGGREERREVGGVLYSLLSSCSNKMEEDRIDSWVILKWGLTKPHWKSDENEKYMFVGLSHLRV